MASNIVESMVDSTASSTRAEDLRPKDLWDEAYNMLWNDKDKKKLIDAYEKFLQNPQSSRNSLQLGTFVQDWPKFGLSSQADYHPVEYYCFGLFNRMLWTSYGCFS